MLERVDAVNRPPRHIRYGWTLYSFEWESIPKDVLQPNQWQSRALGQSLRHSIPQQAGVYMMCVKPPNVSVMPEPFSNFVEIIYVGRSKNLRRRYREHLNTPSPKVHIAKQTYSDNLRFWFLCLPEERISNAESVLISCLGPPANDRPGDIQRLESGSTDRAESVSANTRS